jgi:uncharacterized RDD family membrane protein YckC
MPCSLCGDICRCSSPLDSAAALGWPTEPGPEVELAHPGAEMQEGCETISQSAHETALASGGDSEDPVEDGSAWRQEVAARLNRYHSRHKPRPPRYPSLRLHFEGAGPPRAAHGAPAASSTLPQVLIHNQALALEEFAASAPVPAAEPGISAAQVAPETSAFSPTEERSSPVAAVSAPLTAKIIEFPRSWTPPPVPLDQLAEPVFTRPRILEAPEFVPPPPALGGITIEPAPKPEFEKRPGIDIPLQGAPLARRILSALIDDLILATAGALFGFIFWKVTAIQPPRFQLIGLAAGFASLFWAVYQYLLMVYAGTTPGLRLARLELTRFDGSPAGRRLRRWRVLASYLSAISLGMGYGWVFLDEDSLCWHDRITHTYLAPVTSQRKRQAPGTPGDMPN